MHAFSCRSVVVATRQKVVSLFLLRIYDLTIKVIDAPGTRRREGALLGIPATGRHLQWDAIDLYRLEGGKISQEWASEDLSAILFDTGTYKTRWIP